MKVRRLIILGASAILLAGCTAGPAPTMAPSAPPADPEAVGDRAAHSATTLADRSVLIAGGCVTDGCTSATNEAVILRAGEALVASPMSTARDAHTATLLAGGTVLVTGGFIGEGLPPESSAELFDPGTNTWMSVGSLVTRRGGHAAALLGDGAVAVAGGWVSRRTYTGSIEVYHPSSRRFSPGPSLPEPADSLAAVSLNDGSVLITGGQRSPGVASDQALLLAPDGSTATVVGPLRQARFKHTMVLLPDGRVLVVGGTSDDRGLLRSTEVFDPTNRRFMSGPDLSDGRYKLAGAAAVLADGRVAVGGGGPGVEVLDLKSGTTAPLAGASSTTASFGTVTASAGYLYLVGGYDERIALTGRFMVLPDRA